MRCSTPTCASGPKRSLGAEAEPRVIRPDDEVAGPPIDIVTSLAWAPDGSLLASGSGRPSRSGEIKLWNVADGGLVRPLAHPHSDTVMSLEFSRRGDLLASGGADRFLKVHAVADGAAVRSFEGHTGHVLGVAWQANGRRLASAGADGAIKIWDFTSGVQQRTIAVGKKSETRTFALYSEAPEIAQNRLLIEPALLEKLGYVPKEK